MNDIRVQDRNLLLSKEELMTCDYKKGDTEGLVNFALSISKVSGCSRVL